jgi:hypothetical protein
MSGRAVRSLEFLERSASTARVLNLLKISKENRHNPEWKERPLFRTPALNICLVVKHRLRRNETDAFRVSRQNATKVIVPIDQDELKSGGRYVFVDQSSFEATMQEVFGISPDHPDVKTLRLIDQLPSLDPFLMREHLRARGVDVAPCYFALSSADLNDMIESVKDEITPLVALSLGGKTADPARISRMASKILSDGAGDGMEVLGQTLRLNPEQYQEGIFCWKGFLYYKWSLGKLAPQVGRVTKSVATVKPIGATDQSSREYIDKGRASLVGQIRKTCLLVQNTLSIYDKAYAGLTQDGDPLLFRDFLLQAPAMFATLGEQLGAIQHIISFWNFRFGGSAHPPTVDELIDIFMDFESSLKGRDDK